MTIGRYKAISNENSILEMKNNELVVLIYPDGFEMDWQETREEPDEKRISLQKELYDGFRENAYKALLRLGFSGLSAPLSDSVSFLEVLASSFTKALSREPDAEFLREKTVIGLEPEEGEHILRSAPYMNGAEHLDASWVAKIWDRLNEAFSIEIRDHKGSVAEYIAAQNPSLHLAGKVFFHLVESKKEDYPFAFLATYSSGVSKDGKMKHLPLKNALIEYAGDDKKLLDLLSTVNKASQKSAFVSGLVESGEMFHPLGLTGKEAFTFLKEIPVYEEAGILCRIPNWWKNKNNSLKVSVKVGGKPPSMLGADAIVDFDVRLSMGDEAITLEELKKLLSEAEGLAFIKGKWVEVDHDKLKEALKAYEQAQKLLQGSDMSMIEAIRLQLNLQEMAGVSEKACGIQVTNGEWLDTVIGRLARPDTIGEVPCGEGFLAHLRPYQQKGLDWLQYMKALGLGACLADDMGLGKTVQVIALLNNIRYCTSSKDKRGKTLIVIPASLIGNWSGEITRFAPLLKYCILHPAENRDEKGGAENCRDLLGLYDVFITTYGMLLRYDWLREEYWDIVVLDEAQAIKNPGTKQTKAAKQLKAGFRIAMTGTPVENRLSDLWSLFDFLNRGLLGSTGEFSRFADKLKENGEGYSRLKKVVSPFILRRLKTDRSVIADLPDKIEMKTYSTLSKKQAALYEALVNDIRDKLESAEQGIERKGLILSSLLKFKQICNHPDQYLGQGVYEEGESGKYARLREICETIYEKRERALVFTQFKEITGPLKDFLESVFRHKGLVLHGETPVAKRKDIVEQFQGYEYVPFLVLSLKAGGVGLNLTSANHVVHFDRWWNPAVENQATDRAFRIGQKKNVIVHKFITKGTIEEKIDALIEDKMKLSRDIIPDAQENWITEMDNKQLMELFKLSV